MNLIITCSRHFEPEATAELRKVLSIFGDEDPKITISEMSGILTADTHCDPFEVTRKIKAKVIEEPWSIRYCLRIIPIQEFTNTDLEEILNAVGKLVKKIKEDESYRITVEKRNHEISSKLIISKLADEIQNKVSLEKPDWVVLVEIIGNKTGLAVLRDEDVFRLEITKRELME